MAAFQTKDNGGLSKGENNGNGDKEKELRYSREVGVEDQTSAWYQNVICW